jgi:hypothetical protein
VIDTQIEEIRESSGRTFMPASHRISQAPPVQSDEWLELPDETVGTLLRQLQSDNRAFDSLREALERDFHEVRRAERDPEWLDALA